MIDLELEEDEGIIVQAKDVFRYGTNDEEVEIQVIGAGASNQAIKAIAIARGFVAPSGINLISIPAFTTIEINGKERTAIKLIIKEK